MVNPKLAVALTGRSGQQLEEYKKLILDLNNRVVTLAPTDLIINTHVCRGNYHSTFFSSGAYDGVADLLFGEEHVNTYYLEYDVKDPAGFAPLAKVSEDKKSYLDLSLPRLLLSRIKKMSLQESTKLPNTFHWTDCISVRNAALPPVKLVTSLPKKNSGISFVL